MKNLFRISAIILSIILIHSCTERLSPPIITTTDVTEISYTTATSGGEVINKGGAPIVSKGVCWNTTADPTIEDSKTTESGGSGAFTSNITQLTPNTIYYVKAYATNSAGTGYGNQVSFITVQVAVPSLTTTAITTITQTSAVSGGNITADNGGPVTAKGVCWGIATNPTIANNKTTEGTGTGAFTSSITGLMPATTYYLRAFATNSAGTSYGTQLRFATLADLPTITTSAITGITSAAATCGGNVTSDGGATIILRGVCWSSTANPTIADSKTTDDIGTGAFTSSITGLTAGTTYYIRAYATNSIGTAYGNQKSLIAISIGNSFQGGKLAYLLQAGDLGYDANIPHGLIAAPFDQSVRAVWGCINTEISGADGIAIGTGYQNTIDILKGCTTEGIAAKLCYDLELNGYSDWYLPSRDELNKLYINKSTIGGFIPDDYWSSSEYNQISVWSQSFSNGSFSIISKYDTYDHYATYVRAIRSF